MRPAASETATSSSSSGSVGAATSSTSQDDDEDDEWWKSVEWLAAAGVDDPEVGADWFACAVKQREKIKRKSKDHWHRRFILKHEEGKFKDNYNKRNGSPDVYAVCRICSHGEPTVYAKTGGGSVGSLEKPSQSLANFADPGNHFDREVHLAAVSALRKETVGEPGSKGSSGEAGPSARDGQPPSKKPKQTTLKW